MSTDAPEPRLLTIMGSGETAPTMAKVHRSLIERVGRPAVLLDTPFGFQENADVLTEKALEYFSVSVGHPIGVASYRSAATADARAVATALARVREAHYVFAGPGSPTYALRQWASSPIPAAIIEKLQHGPVAVTFASAAALTVGKYTVPVYEVYKVGETPVWRDGLDLLGQLFGVQTAVIPHYDNAEGGNHDTRFCYLGERRLEKLEGDLPDDALVLGVDEHTALTFDLDGRRASISGLGGVTVRHRGVSATYPTGATIEVDALFTPPRAEAASASGVRADPVAAASGTASLSAASRSDGGEHASGSPLLMESNRLEREFRARLAGGDPGGAVTAILDLDETLREWSRDSTQSDEPDRVRAVLQSLIVRLGEAAAKGVGDPKEPVAPFVDLLLELRKRARAAKDWGSADFIRDGLIAAEVEVRDSPDGTTWELTGESAQTG